VPDVEVVCGDAYDLVRSLSENSVDLILTSPPYFGLRNYGTCAVRVWGGAPSCSHRWQQPGGELEVRGQFCPACGAWRGQLGLEPSVGMYVEHLRDFFRLCLRVLKPWGNVILNLGDTFARSPGKGGSGPGSKERAYAGGSLAAVRKGKRDSGKWCRLSDQATRCEFPEKMKLGIPWRVRFALNDDGWVSRDDIVWEKPNSMPSSAGSRLTTTYEMVFRFVRDVRPGPYCRLRSSALLNAPDVAAEFGRRCATWGSVGILPREMCEPEWARHLVRLDAYFDLDAVRLPLAESSVRRALQATLERQHGGPKAAGYAEAVMHEQKRAVPNLLRSLKAKVSREQGKFGLASVSRTVDGLHDGEWGRYFHPWGKNPGDVWSIPTEGFEGAHFAVMPLQLCRLLVMLLCPPGGLVLDPFCGSGTVLVAAAQLGRRALGFEVNPEYADLARARLAREGSQVTLWELEPVAGGGCG